jgi:CO dehydrogenase/acetyl-CoA synthase alpha subunit
MSKKKKGYEEVKLDSFLHSGNDLSVSQVITEEEIPTLKNNMILPEIQGKNGYTQVEMESPAKTIAAVDPRCLG